MQAGGHYLLQTPQQLLLLSAQRTILLWTNKHVCFIHLNKNYVSKV